MIIGFIGAGDMATAIAAYALKNGHSVKLLGRDTAKLQHTVAALGSGASVATVDNVAVADLVILSVNWPDVSEALSQIAVPEGTILIDATNALLRREPTFEIADLGDLISTEVVQGLVPGARVVKAFNTIRTEDLRAGPWRGDARRVIMVSSDHVEAKQSVVGMIRGFGFLPIDLGGLSCGGRLQSFGGPLATGHDFLVTGDRLEDRT
jgi:predicted dinucleotide-binding enzyme